MPGRRWSRPSSGLWGTVSRVPLVVLLLSLFFFFLTNLRVEEVTCLTKDGGVCPAELKNALGGLRGKPIFFLGTSWVKSRFGFVRSIKTKWRFPRAVEVVVEISKPVVAVTSELGSTGSAWYLIDSQGSLVEQSFSPPSLPRLRLPESEWKFAEHKLISANGGRAIPILLLLGAKYPGVEAQLKADGDLETQVEGIKVLFSPEKDPSVSVATLQLALNEPTIQENRPKLIDLRFQNTVLSY